MKADKKLSKGVIALIVILAMAVLGVGGYLVYDKYFAPTDNYTFSLNGLVSIKYTTATEDETGELDYTTKTVDDLETMTKIINALNTRVVSDEPTGGTLTPELELDYTNGSVTIFLMGGSYVVIYGQLYEVPSFDQGFCDYIESLFE